MCSLPASGYLAISLICARASALGFGNAIVLGLISDMSRIVWASSLSIFQCSAVYFMVSEMAVGSAALATRWAAIRSSFVVFVCDLVCSLIAQKVMLAASRAIKAPVKVCQS